MEPGPIMLAKTRVASRTVGNGLQVVTRHKFKEFKTAFQAMNQGLIPNRYAKALYEYAAEHGCAEELRTQMQALSEAFAAEPSLSRAMGNPFVSRADKEQLLYTASGVSQDDAKGVAGGVFKRFVALLGDNNRLALAREVALAYQKIYRDQHNIRLVKVTTAAPMGEAEETRLKKLIQRHLGDATMEYTSSVDPDLIGGFTVSIDNEKLDASVANELKQLRLKLLSK